MRKDRKLDFCIPSFLSPLKFIIVCLSMPNHKKIGLTLLETIIVMIIVGILATLAIPRFTASQERAHSSEAIASLKMIGAAERMYRLELTPNAFVACSCNSAGTGAGQCNNDPNGCNFLLKLSLNTDNWTYAVTQPLGPSTFRATADRIGAGGFLNCQYVFTDADADPVPAVAADCP